MPTIQREIDSSIAGVSVFNLALNVAGLIFNKKNVALYIKDEKTGKLTNILEGGAGKIGDYTNIFGISPAIMTAEIREQYRLAEHPLEDGKVAIDNKVKLPIEVDVKITLPPMEYKKTLEKLREYNQKNQMIYIETNYGNYDNMQIIGLPATLNSENINRITFTVRFKEVLVAVNTEKAKTENKNDADTQNIGAK